MVYADTIRVLLRFHGPLNLTVLYVIATLVTDLIRDTARCYSRPVHNILRTRAAGCDDVGLLLSACIPATRSTRPQHDNHDNNTRSQHDHNTITARSQHDHNTINTSCQFESYRCFHGIEMHATLLRIYHVHVHTH